MKYIIKGILFVFTLTFSISCGEEQPKNIMGEHVDYLIYVNAWDNELSAPLVSKPFPAAGKKNMGLGGILAVSNPHNPIAANIYRLFVYDLACPYERNANILLSVNDRTQAYCKTCGSLFNIIDGNGSKLEGPSETGLQVYTAIHQNDRPGVFRVTR